MPKDIILLTGAGFTRNYNGFLSSDMWEQFFNNPKMPDKLKSLMRRGSRGDDDYFNYEDVVQKVMVEDDYRDSRDVIKVIVEETYNRQQENINRYASDHASLVGRLKDFVFNHIGLFFTLNQDTFVERYLHEPSTQILSLPYLENISSPNDDDIPFKLPEQKDTDVVSMPTLNGDKFVNYIKLHGSKNWYDSQGKNFPVIGKNKRELIDKEPLLKAYFSLFAKSMCEGKKLLVIGYSFADKHINEIILQGISKGMKLFVIDTISSRDFWHNLMGTSANPVAALLHVSGSHRRILRDIWPGLSGYLRITNIDEFLGSSTAGPNEAFPVLFS
ncbi:MAG: SIR2 family protein [Candidatus Margulisiibacteriota bacterium]